MSAVHIVLSLSGVLAFVAVVAQLRTAKLRASDDANSQQFHKSDEDSRLGMTESSVRARGAYERGHRDRLASTHAETPHARSRASISGS